MMTSLFLSLAMFGAADSTDCAPPSSWVRVSNKNTITDKCTCDCDSCGKCGVAPPTTKTKIEPLIEPFQTHRMKDRYGVVWEHSDKSYLEKYIQQRNSTPIYYYGTGSSCATGTCPRR